LPPDTVDGFQQLPTAEELGLENQLLALEVRVLRGRERVVAEQRARERNAPTQTQTVVPEGKVLVSREVYDDLREAKRKLRWLLRRLGSGPIGWFVRGRSGYKNLASRWLDDEDGTAPDAEEPASE
jgi:hypothetical protein